MNAFVVAELCGIRTLVRLWLDFGEIHPVPLVMACQDNCKGSRKCKNCMGSVNFFKGIGPLPKVAMSGCIW